MQPYILFAVFIFALLVAGLGIVLVVALRNVWTSRDPEMFGKRPQGYWMGIGIASGLPLGYILALMMGILTDDMSLFVIFGPSLGIGFGVAIGAALEQRYKNTMRPLTEAEQRLRKRAMWGGAVLVILGLLVLLGVMLFAA
jgi:hypothetical protein